MEKGEEKEGDDGRYVTMDYKSFSKCLKSFPERM
jgi:hypothetical protein